MKKFVVKTAILVSSGTILFASGWRIPEQSVNSIALSGAYVANSSGADASYYNPANMSFNENKNQMELSLTSIQLSSIKYTDNKNSAHNGNSLKEDFLLPTMFLSSKNYDGFRYGFSLTAPGGLSKKWDDTYAKTFAEDFTLKIIELNPTVAYKVSNDFSIAGGIRAVFSKGVTKSDGYMDLNRDGTPDHILRDMPGDYITAYGYNIALAYKPTINSNISATYRSNIDLKEDGTASLLRDINGSTVTYYGGANVTVPLPAVLAIATSFKFENTTLELEYEKTYWSKYESLDFEYTSTIIDHSLIAVFDNPKAKNWKDTKAYRIGLTHQFNNKLTGMFGYAIDKNPVPDSTLSFELPDSDAKLYSCGFNYKIDNVSSFGMAYLYDKKESRDVVNTYLNGTFSNASATLISAAYRRSF